MAAKGGRRVTMLCEIEVSERNSEDLRVFLHMIITSFILLLLKTLLGEKLLQVERVEAAHVSDGSHILLSVSRGSQMQQTLPTYGDHGRSYCCFHDSHESEGYRQC